MFYIFNLELVIMFSKWLSIIMVGILGYFLLGNDLWQVITWWLALFFIGVIFLPFTAKLLNRFFDKGYLFSKTIGLALATFSLWMLSSLKVLPFITETAIAILIIAFGLIWFIFKGWKSGKEILGNHNLVNILVYEEAVFLLGLVFWAFIRGQYPALDIHGIEKFMDFAFLNNLSRTKFMPPVDMWYAGKPANYYYYGHYVFAFLTRITGIKTAITYSLGIATMFTFGFSLTFSLAANLIFLSGKKKVLPIILGGLISAALLALGGNFHTFVYTTAVPFLKNIGLYHGEVKPYFFADPRSYVGTTPPTDDKLITEYPSYSYLLGDLHAQIIDVFFVLTFLAVLLALVARLKEEFKKNPKPKPWYYLPQEMVILILLLPVMWMTNAWDYPMYAIVLMMFLLGLNLIRYDFKEPAVTLTLINTSKAVILSLLLLVPFLWYFINPTEGISFTRLNHLFSPVYLFQMFVLWGYQLILAGLFFGYLFKTEPRWLAANPAVKSSEPDQKTGSKKKIESAPPLSAAEEARLDPKISGSFWQRLRANFAGLGVSDFFVLIICICAIGLIIGLELFYQKDAAGGGDNYRANTVWKVGLQAFVLFDIAAGYIAIRLFSIRRSKGRQYLLGAVVSLVIILAMFYPFWALGQPTIANFKGLDGTTYLKSLYPDDYQVIQWLNNNVKDQPVTLEANGDSYTDYERISSNTGLPTIMGWPTHQWFWRGGKYASESDERTKDVATVYESADLAATQTVLQKYQVKYIILGKMERDKFPALNESKLLSLGSVVFESPGTKIIEVK
jgi:YYY domain-containing protein